MSEWFEYLKISSINYIMSDIFGNWINNTSELNDKYINNTPYEHVIIKNFFKEEYINKLIENYPEIK